MRLVWSLLLVLAWAFTSRATGLFIPLEVEQPPTIISQTSSPVIALPFDNTLTIRCEARGNPPPKYRWTKDDQDLILPNAPTIRTDPTNGTIMFHSKHFHQFQGKYRCFASNKLGTAMSEDIKIVVSSSPKFPKENLDPIIVEEGEPIVLQCNPPNGVAPRQLYWMSIGLRHIEQDQRVSMGTDGNLYFSHALQKDSRNDYCCFAAFPKIRTIVQKTAMAVVVKSLKPDNDSSDGGSSTETSLERAPSMLLPPGVQTMKLLLKGEDLQLECIPGGFPIPKISWMKMGGSLASRTKMSNFNKLLTITAVDEKDQGQYMCMAENSAGKVVHYFNVIVEEPPMWLTDPPESQLRTIGSDIHIKCSVSGKPPPDITWRRNGEIFKDDPLSNRRVLDDTVVLNKSRPEDTGVYQCEASNNHGSILANINIMVMNRAPLMLTKDLQEYAVIPGQDIVMNCSVFSSPPSDISWSNEDTIIEGERFLVLENGQSLKITSTEKGDSGEYVCMASNTEGMSAITSVLDVKEPTKIVSAPKDVQIISGTSAQLICQAEYDKSLQDTFEVVWKKDEEGISLSPEENSRYIVEGNMLQIMNVNLNDQGMYTCTAKTILDEDNATALLTVLDVPDAPKTLKIFEVKSPRNIVLSWIPGSDHNSSVTEFVVEYEESQWEPGSWKELQKVAGNQATAELTLHGHLNYQFRVYGVNAVGPGPPSEPTERHKTPPAAPDRNPENIKIQGHLPHQMDISWDPLFLNESNGPGLEYKVSYRKLGLEDVWKEHFVGRPSFSVKNTSTFIPYEIKIQSRNSHGWGPEPKVITGYSGEDVPTAAPRDIAVEVINTTVLRVSWTPVPPATVRGHLGGYNVHWVRRKSFLNPDKTLREHQSMSFPGRKNHAIVPGLEPFSEYKLTVNVFNKKGNGPRSEPVTFNTPEGVPGFVPILTTSNTRTDSILLVWAPPLEANGILSGYLLQYHLLNETSLEVIDSLEMNITGADITQWQVLGLKDGSLYRFHLSACTRAGCGLPLAQESWTVAAAGLASKVDDVSTRHWFIGTMCAVALLTLVAIIVCFVRKNKGGKYAGTLPPQQQAIFSMEKVKEKEALHTDTESQRMSDDYEYSDNDEKPLKGSSLCSGDDAIGDSISRDSLVDYTDGEVEFNEDGSFIGEYSGHKHRGSVNEPRGPSPVTA
ncbi:neural cell adhesion molecule L1-like protein isoform X2 [Melanotaenia boesemani]|nr:neural cell adhesion molecule L1-like protein isoform X2 [Melanotaenia boesemani]XP_041860716.1 neural cell adhesion molecule L1-like protein isoform X2 [Melanotaenia boesemani]XP_041860717.1 neural cell adhesion molecule L1-like protein isoform X2 [Melanotaenia boesemani]